MADNKMSYQMARRLKTQSLGSVIADELIQGEGYGSAIKKAIGLKTQAKVTRLKAKFDPLNIAKFMTGGSRLGPAILGKMTGRSRKDIEYFTGRARPVSTATKIGSLPSTDNSGMNDVLNKIYTFMKKTQEDDIKHEEMRKNFLESRKLEDNKKHKELLDALAKLTGGKTETAEKVAKTDSQSNFLDDLMNAFGIGRDALALLRKLGPMLFNPVTLGVLGIIAGGTLLSYVSANVASDPNFQAAFKKEMDPNGMLGAMSGDAGMAASIMGAAAATPEEKMSRDKKIEVLNKLLQDAPWYTRIYNVGVREYLMKKGLTEKQVNDLIGTSPEEDTGTNIEPVKPPPMPGATPEEASSARSNFAKTDPRLLSAPEPTPNAGQQLNAVTSENTNMKLNEMLQTGIDVINGKTKINLPKPQTSKSKIPPVRNQEETFQRMIYNSTRVV